jgi:PBP1b-binding outer membrane lipoprotein LpoB
MFYRLLRITLFTSFIVGCSSSSDSSTSNTTDSDRNTSTNDINEKVLDNMGVAIQKEFDSYKIVVLCNQKLSESDEISQGTKSLYGKINNKPTNALIKMNGHYENMNIRVEVYQKARLVGTQSVLIKEESSVNFGNILTK